MALQPVKTLSDISTDRCAVVIKNSTKRCESKSLGTKIFRDEARACLVGEEKIIAGRGISNMRHVVDIQQKLLQKLGIAEIRYYDRIKRSNLYRELVDSNDIRTIIANKVKAIRRELKDKAAKVSGKERISKAKKGSDGRLGMTIDLTSKYEEDESYTSAVSYDTDGGYESSRSNSYISASFWFIDRWHPL